MYVNSIYRSKKIRNFVYDLIVTYKYDSFDELSFSDKSVIAAHFMEADAASECIIENENLSFITILLQRSLKGDVIANEDLIDTLKTGVIDYYYEPMEALFYDCLDEFVENEDIRSKTYFQDDYMQDELGRSAS